MKNRAANAPEIGRLISQEMGQPLSQGGQIEGGEVPARPGYDLNPALLTQVHDGMRLMREEAFGPVIAIQELDSPEEALQPINCPTVWAPVRCPDRNDKVKRLSRPLSYERVPSWPGAQSDDSR